MKTSLSPPTAELGGNSLEYVFLSSLKKLLYSFINNSDSILFISLQNTLFFKSPSSHPLWEEGVLLVLYFLPYLNNKYNKYFFSAY